MSKKEKLSLNIVIPVYNEEQELVKSIGTLRTFLSDHMSDFHWNIVIADNASSDRTLSIAKNLSRAHKEVKAVHLDKKGRGRAVKYVWTKYTSDIAAYMDVDLSTDLKHLPPLVHALVRGYDIAIGTRNASGSRVYGRSLLRTLTSKIYIVLIKIFFLVHFSDAQCGFKAITKKAAEQLIPYVEDNGWFFDSELLLIAEKSGFRIYEEPVTWIDNHGSTVRVMRTAQGDLEGLWRIFRTRPWKHLKYAR